MDKVIIKRIVIGLIAIFLLMIATLALHIYLVTRAAPETISSICYLRTSNALLAVLNNWQSVLEHSY